MSFANKKSCKAFGRSSSCSLFSLFGLSCALILPRQYLIKVFGLYSSCNSHSLNSGTYSHALIICGCSIIFSHPIFGASAVRKIFIAWIAGILTAFCSNVPPERKNIADSQQSSHTPPAKSKAHIPPAVFFTTLWANSGSQLIWICTVCH